MKPTTHTTQSGKTTISLLGALAIIAILAAIFGSQAFLGIFPFGPEATVTAKVNRLYIDYSGSKDSQSSHYMVGTDKGVYEVNNSTWLSIYNADELYSSLEQGKTYRLTVKGQKVANFWMQEYPHIIRVEKLE